ncbi:MAG: hypothetical protein AAGF73_17045 [Actinomycetota bacterium]
MLPRCRAATVSVVGASFTECADDGVNQVIDEVSRTRCGTDSLGYNNHFARSIGLMHPDGLDPPTLPATENPNVEGGGFITTGDYGALLLMHLREGRCDDVQVLSREAIEFMYADRILKGYGSDAGDPGTGIAWGGGSIVPPADVPMVERMAACGGSTSTTDAEHSW